MGCDIHVHVERMNAEGRWEFQRPPDIVLFKNNDGSDYLGQYWYWGRNYNLFALLADVRNGRGFAGVDTGDRVEPLDAPRGLPEDVSDEVRAEAEEWGVDGHSHSWFTLRELIHARDVWRERVKVHRGWVTPREFIRWRDEGAPHGWSGGVSGAGVQHVDNFTMQKLIDSGEAVVDENSWFGSHYTLVEWQTKQYDDLGPDWEAFIDRMRKLTMDDGSDVRTVFWFDN